MRYLVVVAVACSTARSEPTPRPITPTAQPRPAASPAPASATAPTPAPAIAIDGVELLAAVDGGTATAGPIYARKDQVVTLHVILRIGKQRVSDPHAIEASGVNIHWFRIEPTSANTSNTQSGSFRFEPIEYRATAIDGATGSSLSADVRPTLTTDHGDGVGTMRYQVVVTRGAQTLATPGIEARRGRGSGGLTDAVMRVSIRRDDTYLGYLTEMFGQPYVWASAGLTDATHQSEHLEGSDCADFMVYGARRMGKRIAYTWTGGLPEVTKLLAAGARSEDGIYRDKQGKPLPYTKEGDLVLFTRHVGALAADRGEKGVLDDQDLVMHTLFDSPKEQAIADTGYAGTPVEIRRFR